MSYVTSQRVEGALGEGINAFLHGTEIGPDVDWEAFDDGRVAIGDLLHRHVSVPAGGNAVLSFLDVVSAETPGPEDVRALLDLEPSEVGERERRWRLGHLAARFRVCGPANALPPLNAELEELVHAAAGVLAEARAASRLPLEIRRTINETEIRFELSPSSVERLRERHGEGWRPAPLRVAHETVREWEQRGVVPVGAAVLKVLTGLTEQELERMGGVRTTTERG